MPKAKKVLRMFLVMVKIGLFTFGGGYAMIALLESELVAKRKWLEKDEFLDMIAVAESTPGPVAVNMATFIGYRQGGVAGAAFSTLGVCLPSFLIILGIALFFQQFRDNETVQRIFKGIRPAVVALIAAPTFKMGKSAKIGMTNVWIPVVSALLIWLLGVSPIYIIIMAGLGGYLYGRYIKPSESK